MRLSSRIKGWKAIAIVCALLLSVGVALALAYSCALHEPGQGQREASSSQCYTQPPLSFLPTGVARAFCRLLAQAKPNTATDEKQAGPEAPDWTDKAQAYSAVAVTFLTLVLIVITIKQFDLLNRSTRAAEGSVQLAKETAAAQLRAYVTLDQIDTNYAQVDEKIVAISFIPVWKNSGATPARRVQYYTVCDFSSNSTPRDPLFQILNVSMNRTIIGPGIEELGPPTRDITAQEMTELAKNGHSICIYGAIDYTDFTEVERRTEFGVMIILGQGTVGSRPFRFNKTMAHNGADEDCLRNPYAKPGDSLRPRS